MTGTIEHNVILHVFEALEIELGLDIESEEAEKAPEYSCSVRLMKDPHYIAR